jgi:ribosomal protein L37AE/L43A
MIVLAPLLLSVAVPAAIEPRCTSFATLSAADQKQYGSRYRFRVRTKGKAVAEQWVRSQVCPEARAARRERRRAPLTRADGRPCTKTRTEMRPVTSGGSMTMLPHRVCIR